MSKKPSPSTIAVNKKARHLYELSDFVEAEKHSLFHPWKMA